MARSKFIKKRKAAIFLQKYIRMFVYRTRYIKIQKATVKIQSVIRGWYARDYFRQLKAEKIAKEQAAKHALEAAARKEAEEERRQAAASGAAPVVDEEAEQAAKREAEEKNLANLARNMAKPKKVRFNLDYLHRLHTRREI